MSVHCSRASIPVDSGGSTVMRRTEDGSETAPGISGEPSVPLHRLKARWANAETDSDEYIVEFVVANINVSGNAVYSLIVFQSDTSGGPRTEVARIPTITATGTHSISIDAAQLSQNANWLSCAVEISGAPRSINYGASLRKGGVKFRQSTSRAHDARGITSKGRLVK